MRLALDAFGGDHAPEVCVDGALAFAREHPADVVLLVGDKARLEVLLGKKPKSAPGNVRIHHASQVVGMGEHGPQAIRGKKDSSLRRCIELHRDGEADAFVSAGNSGAVMAGATLLCGRVEGVTRPAFAALLPQVDSDRPAVMIDAGANIECTPAMLAQFGVLGEAWARSVLHVARPKVALLSNGEEEGKGTPLTRDALELLKKSPLNVVGYVEGNALFISHCDVVVTDGFTGNVALKTSEGAASAVASLLKGAIERAGMPEKLGAVLLKPTLAGLRKVVDYAEYGGAPMLGIDGVGIVAHGRSKGRAIERALVAARRTAQAGLKQMQIDAMKAAAAWLPG